MFADFREKVMKFIFPLLVAFFLGLINVSVRATENQNQENLSSQTDTVPANRYQVSGDRLGRVTVKDTVSGEVIRTFQMEAGVVVREKFLLDNGRTVAASQKDHTVFWDVATGREIGRVSQRVYGFSHDEKKFFTQKGQEVFLYAYPDLTRICKLTKEAVGGTGGFQFAPDDSFLVIWFYTGFPSSDNNYPSPNLVDSSVRDTKLFKLQNCQEVQEFSVLRVKALGQFSSDSKFYELQDTLIRTDARRLSKGSWRFDLMTYKLQGLAE